MEIDDILESLEDDVLHSEDKDLKALTRAWVTERSAPEVLPWPTELMDRVLTGIHEQVCVQTVLHSAPSSFDGFAKDRAGRGANRQRRPKNQLSLDRNPDRARTL